MILLYADDNPYDQQLAKEALVEAGIRCDLRCVNDGKELLDCLYRRGRYSDADPIRPDLILLDVNMPGKDGLEVLADIKGDLDLWQIPVVVLTSSEAEADIFSAYNNGATAYMRKPTTFVGFVEAMEKFSKWWLDTVELPNRRVSHTNISPL